MKLKFFTNKKTGIFSAALIFVVALSLFLFEKSIQSVVNESSNLYLMNMTRLYAGTFEMKIFDQLDLLESQARYFKNVDMDDYNSVKKAVLSIKGAGQFKQIAVADENGMTLNYDGKATNNISMHKIFRDAMNGRYAVSQVLEEDEDHENVLSMAVPIVQGPKKIGGVITGTISSKFLIDTLADNMFEKGEVFAATPRGYIIVRGENNSESDFSNYLNFLSERTNLSLAAIGKIKNELQNRTTSFIEYKIDGKKFICTFAPTRINDWIIFSIVPAQAISAQKLRITIQSIIEVVLVFVVCMIFLFVFARLSKSNAEAKKNVERYSLAAEYGKTILFEYDPATKEITLSGNVQPLVGKKGLDWIKYDLAEFKLRLHPDDQSALSGISEFIYSPAEAIGKKINTEFRLLVSGQEYCWFRMTGSVEKDHEGNAAKFFGNLVNVNDQVAQERELHRLAEMDSLSNLLNKGFMNQQVSELIKKHSAEIVGAFFIIDMDNFKQVNDTLGHSVGDLTISDVSQKLKLVFSQRDYIGRIGGDEFCVFLRLDSSVSKEKELSVVNEKAQTLKSILSEDYANENQYVTVTASIGISLFPEHGSDYRTLFDKADRALYSVKRNGKNNFAIYNDSMQEKGESVYESI